MSMHMREIVKVPGMAQSGRDLSPEQRERLRVAVWPHWEQASKVRKESQEAFAKRTGLGSQSLFSSFIGRSINEPGRGGVSLAKALAAIRHLGLDGRAILGADWPGDGDNTDVPTTPKESVKSTDVYRLHASPKVRERFDNLGTYRRTPDGAEKANDVVWFTKKLVQFIEEELEGEDMVPPGGELIQAADQEPEATPPSRPARAPRRRA